MKKLVSLFFVVGLFASCGASGKANDASAEKAKIEKAAKPKPAAKPVKAEYEEM
jgi:hypothetical protein